MFMAEGRKPDLKTQTRLPRLPSPHSLRAREDSRYAKAIERTSPPRREQRHGYRAPDSERSDSRRAGGLPNRQNSDLRNNSPYTSLREVRRPDKHRANYCQPDFHSSGTHHRGYSREYIPKSNQYDMSFDRESDRSPGNPSYISRNRATSPSRSREREHKRIASNHVSPPSDQRSRDEERSRYASPKDQAQVRPLTRDQEESSDSITKRKSALDRLVEPLFHRENQLPLAVSQAQNDHLSRSQQLEDGEYDAVVNTDEVIPETREDTTHLETQLLSRDRFNRRNLTSDLSSEATIPDLPPLSGAKQPIALRLGLRVLETRQYTDGKK